MKIAIIGSKGIPANYGGFETFAFQLAKHLANNSHEITVVNEKNNHAVHFEFPVRILYSEYEKSKNPLLFYKQSLELVCKTHDLVLVCGVGGAAFYPINKGKAVVVTNVDGLEHLRGKYTFFQRRFVFMLQKLATIFSSHLVADSDEVKKYWVRRFPKSAKKLSAIAYGADVPFKFNDSILSSNNISSNDYFLVVARLVPENNLQLIIDAFSMYKGEKKLVIVGVTDDNPFAKSISTHSDKRILFIGGIYEKDKLDSLRKNCFAYIHGHSVGGTNPALLEAMICNCACLCHDNVFNREVTDNKQLYFSFTDELVEGMERLEKNIEQKSLMSKNAFDRVTAYYSWPMIAKQYEELFSNLLLNRKR